MAADTAPTFVIGDGMVVTPVGSANDAILGLALQPDGRIIAAGIGSNGANDDLALVRYNADGSLDTSFGGGDGIATAPTRDGSHIVVLQPDGKILIGGRISDGINGDFALVRYNADGSLDLSFDGASTLGGTVSYTENGTGAVLDGNVAIYDAELVAAGNYAGATLTLQRHGGANAEDHFAASGALAALNEGGPLVVSGSTIGMVTESSAGRLVLTFGSGATQSLVDSAMQAMAYANSSNAPPTSVDIVWSFSDGNTGAQGSGGALVATGTTTVTITAANSAPTAVVLTPVVTSIGENTSLSSGVKVADITVTDDDLGTNTLSLSGADASAFELVGSALFLRAGTVLDYEAKGHYDVASLPRTRPWRDRLPSPPETISFTVAHWPTFSKAEGDTISCSAAATAISSSVVSATTR